MADKTGIEWTDATWNPVRGCSRVSEGCRNCYAERVAARFSGPGQPYEGLADRARSGSKWTGRVRLVESALHQPWSWSKPRRIFVNSMSDLFHESLTDGEILRVMRIIWGAPRHTFQILTKRPERMRAWFAAWNDVEEADPEPKMARGPDATRAAHTSGRSRIFASMLESMGTPPPGAAYPTYDWAGGPRWWGTAPAHNLWLGVSVEHQAAADERIPHLLATPAAVRFLSCEPLLGPVDLTEIEPAGADGTLDALNPSSDADIWASDWDPASHGTTLDEAIEGAAEWGIGYPPSTKPHPKIHWVIAGGESGPGARPMHPDWARSLRDQCAAAGVPFLFKQWGEWTSHEIDREGIAPHLCCIDAQGRDCALSRSEDDRAKRKPWWFLKSSTSATWTEAGNGIPVGVVEVRRVGKKAAGRLLDGVQHDGLPA